MATEAERVLATLQAILRETDPTLDVGPGAIKSLLLSPATALALANESKVQEAIDRYDLSQLSVSSEEALLDELATRYGVQRSSAGFASGVVTVVLDSQFPVVIPANTLLTNSSGTYLVNDSYAFRATASSVINSTDRLLVSRGDGTFSADINVRAVAVGEAQNIAQGEPLTLVEPLEHVISLFAARDFSGGVSEEVGADLVTRIRDSHTQPGIETAFGVESLIRREDNFPLADAISVVGAGDSEMRRDKDNSLGFGGGMVDVYVRTRRTASTVTVVKAATDLGVTGAFRDWEIKIARDDFPGWWDVIEVVDSAGKPATLISDSRGVDTAPAVGLYTPVIPNAEYGAYSAYQTSVLHVRTLSSVVSGSFSVALRGMPEIDNVQKLLSSRQHRPVGGDLLVKAPVPCFVNMTLTLEPDSPDVALPADNDLILRAVDRVNRAGFAGRLYSSQLVDAVAGPRYSVVSVLLEGFTLLPDGTTRHSVSEKFLEAPVVREHQTSWRTVIFVASPQRVNIVKQTATSNSIA